MTGIEWTDKVWNPTTGCDRVSPGCDHCYALDMAKRLKGMGQAKYQLDGDPRTSGPGFGVAVHHDSLNAPFRWRKPQRVFVNSMSDLFHPRIPDGFIGSVFNTMALTPQHTYQILTKRPKRMRALLRKWEAAGWMWRRDDMVWCGPIPGPLPNVWLGTSVEDQRYADERIPDLLDTPAAVRFLSCEPLLGPVSIDRYLWLTGASTAGPFRDHAGRRRGGGGIGGQAITSIRSRDLHWVIVGGESGSSARPMHPDWARRLRDECVTAEVPYFFKQWGRWGDLAPLNDRGVLDYRKAHSVANDGTVYADDDLAYPDGPRYGEAIRAGHDRAHLTFMFPLGKGRTGRDLDGRTWDEFPTELAVSA